MTPLTTPSTLSVAGSSPFALGSMLILLALLVAREMTSALADRRAQRLQSTVDISLIPLLIIFSMVVLTAIIQALG